MTTAVSHIDLASLAMKKTWKLRAGDDGTLCFPDGTSWSDRTSLPAWLRRCFGGRIAIEGFWCFENPEAELLGQLSDRHDFAVLDKRWIVDPWIAEVTGRGPAIIDIHPGAFASNHQKFYGLSSQWERSHWLEDRVDRETASTRCSLLNLVELQVDAMPAIAEAVGQAYDSQNIL